MEKKPAAAELLSKPRLKPTVIDFSAVPAQRSQPPVLATKPQNINQPTTVRGVERKRIAVSSDDLLKLSPSASPALRESALGLIETFVVEDASERSVVLWGHRLQVKYSELVTQTLDLVQAQVLIKTSNYVGRVTSILSSIDLLAACGVTDHKNLLGHYLNKMNSKIDSPEELAAARAELSQLVVLMAATLDDLLIHKEKLQRHMNDIDALGNDVEAASLAAEFLAGYLRNSKQQLAQLFVDRSISLMQSLAQIRSGAAIREAQIDQPMRLINAVQNVALVSLPGWLESVAALITVAQTRKPTATEASELSYKITDILQRLKI